MSAMTAAVVTYIGSEATLDDLRSRHADVKCEVLDELDGDGLPLVRFTGPWASVHAAVDEVS